MSNSTRCSGTNCGCVGKQSFSKFKDVEIKLRAILDVPKFKAKLLSKTCILQVYDDDKDEPTITVVNGHYIGGTFEEDEYSATVATICDNLATVKEGFDEDSGWTREELAAEVMGVLKKLVTTKNIILRREWFGKGNIPAEQNTSGDIFSVYVVNFNDLSLAELVRNLMHIRKKLGSKRLRMHKNSKARSCPLCPDGTKPKSSMCHLKGEETKLSCFTCMMKSLVEMDLLSVLPNGTGTFIIENIHYDQNSNDPLLNEKFFTVTIKGNHTPINVHVYFMLAAALGVDGMSNKDEYLRLAKIIIGTLVAKRESAREYGRTQREKKNKEIEDAMEYADALTYTDDMLTTSSSRIDEALNEIKSRGQENDALALCNYSQVVPCTDTNGGVSWERYDNEAIAKITRLDRALIVGPNGALKLDKDFIVRYVDDLHEDLGTAIDKLLKLRADNGAAFAVLMIRLTSGGLPPSKARIIEKAGLRQIWDAKVGIPTEGKFYNPGSTSPSGRAAEVYAGFVLKAVSTVQLLKGTYAFNQRSTKSFEDNLKKVSPPTRGHELWGMAGAKTIESLTALISSAEEVKSSAVFDGLVEGIPTPPELSGMIVIITGRLPADQNVYVEKLQTMDDVEYLTTVPNTDSTTVKENIAQSRYLVVEGNEQGGTSNKSKFASDKEQQTMSGDKFHELLFPDAEDEKKKPPPELETSSSSAASKKSIKSNTSTSDKKSKGKSSLAKSTKSKSSSSANKSSSVTKSTSLATKSSSGTKRQSSGTKSPDDTPQPMKKKPNVDHETPNDQLGELRQVSPDDQIAVPSSSSASAQASSSSCSRFASTSSSSQDTSAMAQDSSMSGQGATASVPRQPNTNPKKQASLKSLWAKKK